jgi:hypothetical protein
MITVGRAGAIPFGFELCSESRYVWRGMPCSQGPVAQPSLWLSLGNFTLSPWANYVLGPEENRWKFNEVDLYLTYSRELAGLSLEPSLAYYVFPNQPDVPATAELNLALSCPFGPLELTTTHTLDLLEYRGAYFGDLGLSYEYEFDESWSAGLSASAGLGTSRFNDAYFETPRTALNVISAETSVTWSGLGLCYLRPHLNLNTIPDAALRESAETTTTLSGGLALGREF